MLRNSAMVLGSGAGVGVPTVAIWAWRVVWPLLTDEGTSSSWSFLQQAQRPGAVRRPRTSGSRSDRTRPARSTDTGR